MPFCTNCGHKIDEKSNFCAYCGQKVIHGSSTSSVREEYAGKLLKCPNCGQELAEFETICPSCGYELREKRAVRSVQELSDKIAEIHNRRNKDTDSPYKRFKFTGNPFKAYSELMAMSMEASERMLGKTPEVQEEIDLIKNYPIPNTVSEIIEFMILAEANIDVSLSKKTFRHTPTGYENLSNAWLAKMKQAYHKAELIMSDDPKFAKITELYVNKMNELNMKF